MKFTPRLIAPQKTDKKYYSNINPYYAEGHGMPNCVAYAWSRFYEIIGTTPNFVGQPEKWYANAQKAGYKVGQTPKLGAIIVWKKGNVENPKDGTGHVAVVEKIYDNGDFDSSNSQYNGKEFFMQKITKASGYQYAGGFDFLGFIYPGIEFESETSSSGSSTAPSTYEVHTVEKGDTLWNISVKYLGVGSRYTEIMKLNNLSSTVLTIGQKLKIPSNYQCIHTVVKGDTLWNLAVKYLGKGSRYPEIKKLNNLSSDALGVGMKLKIPNK